MTGAMRENLSDAVEDYLKAIYELSLDDTPATTNHIAARLGVAPASVTGMLKRLSASEPPLLDYQKHRGATLTPEGKQVALEVLRHHRLLELFLQESLGYTWDQVHEEADRLEHVISEDLEERIARALGNPQRDPHGDPIPARNGDLPVQQLTQLEGLYPGQQAVVRRVDNEDPNLLRYLTAIELVPQARITVLERSDFDGVLRLELGESEVSLGPRLTAQIYVEVVQNASTLDPAPHKG
jgi:DtxR family Mn-dependent transcriptional regulator